MITTVAYKPSQICTAYNPIVWSVLSDKIAEVDFQYVIWIYVNDVHVNTIKQRPNPAGYGLFDVATIVQPYLLVSNFTQGELEYGTSDYFYPNTDASAKVYCKIGEQYGTGQSIYNGTTDAIGNPSYAVYSAYTNATVSLTNVPVTVLAASLTNHESNYGMQDPANNGIWTENPFRDDVTYDHTEGLAYPLSTDTLTREVYSFDKAIVSFLNWLPGLGLANIDNDSNVRTIYGFRYVVTEPDGTPHTFDIPLIQDNGIGPRIYCSDTITDETLDQEYDIVHVITSPAQIALLTSLAVTDGWSYSIQGFDLDTSCTFGSAITQMVTYSVIEYCENIWPRVRLSWNNQLGSRDYFNFTMEAERTINTRNEVYNRDIIEWSGSTPVPLINTAGNSRLPLIGGNKVYNKTATDAYRITSDWLEEDQITLMESLQKATQVMAYIHKDGSWISDEYPSTCTVKNPSYVINNNRQKKLTTVTFDLEINSTQTSQNQ